MTLNKISKILLGIITLFVAVNSLTFVATDLIGSGGYFTMDLSFFLNILLLIVFVLGLITAGYHLKTYKLVDYDNSNPPLKVSVPIILWYAAFGFAYLLIAFNVVMVFQNISLDSLTDNIEGGVVLIGVTVWVNSEVRKMVKTYTENSNRLKESKL